MTTITDDEIIKLAEQHQVVCLFNGIAEPAWREGTDIGDIVIAFARALLALNEAPKPREAPATLAALADVDRGAAVAPTARKHGIQPSTLFRALKRRREATEVSPQPSVVPAA